MPLSYQTIASTAKAEIEISRSRFLTTLSPVASEEEARAVIDSVRTEHPKARHHCTAFVIGSDAQLQRSNDDGEPSGTGGAPILDAILGAELSDVVAVVTRYFGGVLLGAGGLTRAYRSATAEAIAVAERVTKTLVTRVRVRADYEVAPQVEAWARRSAVPILESSYDSAVSLTLGVVPGDIDAMQENIANASSGRAEVSIGDELFIEL